MRNCKHKWQFTGTTAGLNRSADGFNSIPTNFSQMNQDLYSFVVSTTALISTSPVKRCNCVSAHSHQPLNAQIRVQPLDCPHGIYCGTSGSGTRVSASTLLCYVHIISPMLQAHSVMHHECYSNW
jgi:hypothetical protein